MDTWPFGGRKPSLWVRRTLDAIREGYWWWALVLTVPWFAASGALWSSGGAVHLQTPSWDHSSQLQAVPFGGPPFLAFECWFLVTFAAGQSARLGCMRVIERRRARMVLLPLVGLVAAACYIAAAAAVLAPANTDVPARLATVLDYGDGYGWCRLGGVAGVLACWALLLNESRTWRRLARLWQEPPSPERAKALRRLCRWHGVVCENSLALVDPSVWLSQMAALSERGRTRKAIGLFAKGAPRYRDLPEAMAGFESAVQITDAYAGEDGVRWLLKYVVATCGDSPVAEEARRRLAGLRA